MSEWNDEYNSEKHFKFGMKCWGMYVLVLYDESDIFVNANYWKQNLILPNYQIETSEVSIYMDILWRIFY